MYLAGKGVVKDAKIAEEWFSKAANLGGALVQDYNKLIHDQLGGVAEDAQVEKWLREAASQGNGIARFDPMVPLLGDIKVRLKKYRCCKVSS